MTFVISSTDSYQDCWEPFFTLIQRFIPNINRVKVYLVTDSIVYTGHSYVTTITASKSGEILPWSDRMIIAIKQIEEESFLLLLDDYFLRAPLDFVLLRRINRIIEENTDIGCVSLVPFKNKPNKKEFEIIERINKFKRYRVSLQPAFWDKSYFISMLISGESPWQFELLGSLRSNFTKKKVFAISSDWISKNGLIYDTRGTGGIVKGRWLKSEYNRIEELLGYKIKSSRGFVSEEMRTGSIKRKYKLIRAVIFDHVVLKRNVRFLLAKLLRLN